MSDIVEKLRGFWGDVSNRDIVEAADEIERLRAAAQQARAALEDYRCGRLVYVTTWQDALRALDEALKETP